MRSLAGVLASLALATPWPAAACTPSACSGGLLLHGDATVPAGLAGIGVWMSSRSRPGEPVRLERRARDGTWKAVPAALRYAKDSDLATVGPRGGFRPGAYRVTVQNTCPCQKPWSGHPGPIVITVGPRATPPRTAVLPLVADPVTVAPLRVAAASGACHVTERAAQAALRAEVPPALRPWAGVLLFTTLVDGKPWHPSDSLPVAVPPGMSWRGRGHDLVYSLCSEKGWGDPGVRAGVLAVRMTARIPGTTLEYASPPVSLDIRCR